MPDPRAPARRAGSPRRRSHGAEITDLRGRAGAVLTTVEDLFAWTDLPYAQWDHVREHGLVLAVR